MTRSGLGSLLGGLAFLVSGLLLGWAPLAVLGAGSLLLLASAVVATWRRPRLRIERHVHPSRVPKGSPAIVHLHLANGGRSAVPGGIALQPFGPVTVGLALPRLVRGQEGVRTYRLPTTRRGVFELGPLELVRSDPFGLVRWSERHGTSEPLWVYPQILPLRPLPTGVQRSLEGPNSSNAESGTITFHRIREYATGDDLRMVHWKSTARTGNLMVRHNVDTSQPLTLVVLDLRPAVYSAETFETAVDVAASVVSAATFGRSSVELRTTAGVRLGGRETREAQPLVDHLAAVTPDGSGSIFEQLLLVRSQQSAGTGLVVVTGVLNPEDLPALAGLRRRFQRLVVASITPDPRPALAFPGVRVLSAVDGEGFTRLWNLDALR